MKTAYDLYQERLDAGMDPKKAKRLYKAERAAVSALRAGKRAGRKVREEWQALDSISGLPEDLIAAPGEDKSNHAILFGGGVAVGVLASWLYRRLR